MTTDRDRRNRVANTRPLTILSLALAMAAVPALVGVQPASASIAQPTVTSEFPSNKTPHAIDDGVVANAAVNSFSEVGSTMYAGGRFHTVQNANRTISYTRDNLFSFDIATGTPTSWNPSVNGEVMRTLAAGGFLYVGGKFSTANGVSNHLVRYDLSSGQIDAGFSPAATAGSGAVTDLEYVAGRLIVSGSFAKRIVALNPSTGADTGYINISVAGSVSSKAGRVAVFRFAVDPAATKLVGIGNFTTVNGAIRTRAFMLDLGTSSASLDAWYYQPFTKMCQASSLADYLRDVDFSPDGSYFVIASTGYVSLSGDLFSTVCDAVARFETSIANPTKPTWINYTGGDTLWSVAAVGAAVYVGGHQRWLNNPNGRDSAGPGAVDRPGVGAVSSTTGLALSWNPTKTRGVGLKFIYPTSTGVWFGSDGRLFHNTVHDSIAFTPLP
jgi:hypothetical protein